MQLTVVRRLLLARGGGGEGLSSLASFMAAAVVAGEDDDVDILGLHEHVQLVSIGTVDEKEVNIVRLSLSLANLSKSNFQN